MADDKNPIAANLPDTETSENLPPLVGPMEPPSWWSQEQLREQYEEQERRKQLTGPTSLSRAGKSIDRALAITRVAVIEPASTKPAPVRDGRDARDAQKGEGGGARGEQAPTKPAKKNWYKDPLKAELEAAMKDIAQQYSPDARAASDDIWDALKARPGLEDLPRSVARYVLAQHAPQLLGRPGYHSTKSPS
jgi:hypothetical protein